MNPITLQSRRRRARENVLHRKRMLGRFREMAERQEQMLAAMYESAGVVDFEAKPPTPRVH